MFPNIDKKEVMTVPLISYETKLVKHTKNFPIKQLIRASHLLMKHNVLTILETPTIDKKVVQT